MIEVFFTCLGFCFFCSVVSVFVYFLFLIVLCCRYDGIGGGFYWRRICSGEVSY